MRRTLCLAGIVALLSLTPTVHSAVVTKVRYVKATVTIGPHRFGEKQVVCPTGTRVVGGGVTASSPNVSLLQSMTGLGETNTWAGAAANASGKNQTMTVFAECIKLAELPSGTTITNESRTDTINAGTAGGTAQPCNGTGERPVGGGFAALTTDPLLYIGYSGPHDSYLGDGVPDNFWEVAYENSSPSAVKITLEAICMTPSTTLVYKSNSANGTLGGTTAVKATCDSASQVTGGGTTVDVLERGLRLRSTKPIGLRNTPPGTGWTGAITIPPTNPRVLTTVAICIPL